MYMLMLMQNPDWAGLSDRGLWGVLVGIVAAVVVILTAVILLQRMVLANLAQDRAADNKRLDNMLTMLQNQHDQAIRTIQANTEANQKLAAATEQVSQAMQDVARIVEGCPSRK